jgi:hypothetical protein
VLIDLTQEQLAVRDTVRRFGETEIMKLVIARRMFGQAVAG